MDPSGRTPNDRREEDYRQNLHTLPQVPPHEPYSTFAGFSAYAPRNDQADGGALGLSEPSSPTTPGPGATEVDQQSNESHSSGDRTKVESRSPSAHRMDHPSGKEAGSVESGYGNFNRESDGYDIYHNRINSQPSYTNESFSVSSPSYGRYRQGSYGADGLESGRASTIGTDTGFTPGLPYNSSRTALNHEWRTSDQGSHDGIHYVDEKYGHGHYPTKDITEDLKGGPRPTYVPIPPSSPAMDEKKDPQSSATEGIISPPPVVVSRQNRLEWIDGIRGLASLIIFTHHFSDLTWAQSHPDSLGEGSVYGLLRNGQLAVGMYFLLGGRVLAHSFLRSAFTRPTVPKDSHGTPIPGAVAAKWQGPRWLSLSSSLFRRSIRLAFPAIIVGFIQWRIAAGGLLGDRPIRAAQILAPSALWQPTWNEVGNFWGFLQFCLDLFTNRGHQYMLSVGSALWSTYDQFWGSVLVYILAASVAQVGWIGRYLIYLMVCISLWFINSPNMLYVLGLWLADLHAAGFVRKLQDHWKPTMLVELGVMALAMALIAGGTNVATPANNAMGNITVYEGKFGWDHSLTWPQYMFISNWLPPTCILIWVEVSHAMQWFASWGAFTWLGKVSYGFYLMQFITLYSVMPPLVIYFNDRGRSYWDMIMPTFVICLLVNIFIAWAGYHLLDRVGLKLAKWIWDGFFVTKPNNAGSLPMKALRAFGNMLLTAPGNMCKHAGSKIVTKSKAARKNLHTIMNWRTPTTRPPIPDPTDPDVISQLHSTRWTSDMSGDPEAVRTAALLRFQQYTWIGHVIIIPTVTFLWIYYHPTGTWTYDAFTFSTLWRFIWVLSVPNCLFAFAGFATPDLAPSKAVMDKKPVFREYIRNFFILLVTKGSNENAVRRGYNKLLLLEKYHPAVKVIVLTDEPYVYPDLQNIVCPKSYVSPLGKAKYKARALDYFRYHVSLGVYDWILHMDEESVTDGESLRRCIEFIRYTPHHFGQGIILYNGEGYWENWYFTVADGIRVGDDLARFHFQNTCIHRPVFGVHGSFLMTNGEMENECTWDFGSLAEDFEFSQDAWRRGFTCGRIHGIVREQSPTSLRDFLKQRRRWFMGIRDIDGLYGLPHLAVNLWIVGVFTLAVTIINIPFLLVDKSLTPLWVAACADFCFITFYWLYLWGLIFQELDYGQKWWRIMIHIPCAVVIQPFASVAEGLSAIWAMSSVDFGKFEVIVKFVDFLNFTSLKCVYLFANCGAFVCANDQEMMDDWIIFLGEQQKMKKAI
ncbi:glycosyl transferase family group 2-domain-containing protein [Phakopsora pachyrhizi]|uniref:Glycosyl transferase family group 2-domain-containing protein n=1 Tax=Phakopsora pachyrhizi TaxID=170000 RepID=A0AAV0AEB9_PHAPC|nr:glycosyl transferase family group 2-domain-containing protein [Phakopsora pachyrhizi]